MNKFALVGCGRIAKRHAENIKQVGELTAVCDVVRERADDFAALYQARVYYSLDDLLANEKEVEIISICTPNGMHAEHVIKSLQARKHVLCEKPLCLTTAAAWQILETEKFCRRKLFVVKSTRFNPILQQVKEKLTSGSLGEVYSFHLSCLWNRPESYYTDWKGKRFPDGGTLYTQFSHYIDALLWLFGDIDRVTGFGDNKVHKTSIEFEDTGTVALQMESNTLGTLHWSVNAYRKNHEIALTILAQKATLRIGGEYLQQLQYAEAETPFEPIKTGKEANEYAFYNGSLSHHAEVYQHLIQALDHHDHRFTGAFEGLKTVEAIEKIYKAISQP